MDPEALIQQTLAGRTTCRGGTLYVEREAALDVVRLSRTHGIPILGFEGVIIEDATMTPRLDLIADFSELERRTTDEWADASARSAERVLSQWDPEPGLYITFVFAERGHQRVQ
jgi:hypothetical protein